MGTLVTTGRITFYSDVFAKITIATDFTISYVRDVIEVPELYTGYSRQFFPGEETVEINFVANAKDILDIIDGICTNAITHYVYECKRYKFFVSCKTVLAHESIWKENMCDFTIRTAGGITQIGNEKDDWRKVYNAIMRERGQRTLQELKWKT